MRFDLIDFAAFDIHILARPGAANGFDSAVTEAAAHRFAEMDDARRAALQRNVVFGLPGAAETLTLNDVRAHLVEYDNISAAALRRHLIDFLSEVAPLAERLGVRLCCHPDDPPFALLGLPRVMSTQTDYETVLTAVDLQANGVTLCTGSMGSRPDNDLPSIMQHLGPRVHFLHLRNVRREGAGWPVSFHESGHLDGDVDMVALIGAVLNEEARRRAVGRIDDNICFRPDHGLEMNDDRARCGQPGYPLVGRMVGIAEIRGVIAASNRPLKKVSEPLFSWS